MANTTYWVQVGYYTIGNIYDFTTGMEGVSSKILSKNLKLRFASNTFQRFNTE